MMDENIKVPVSRLKRFVIEVLVKMGVPQGDAQITAEVLLAADLYGVRSHGIAHLKMYYNRIKTGLQLPVTRCTVLHATPTTAVLDGGNGLGMVVGYRAMKMAIERARSNGLGAVAVRNSSHFGVAGYYTRMAAEEDMVGMAFTNAHPSIAPTFGVEPLLGTNPVAFSAPTDEAFPFSFDAATSISPRGAIEVAARAGKSIPEGWVIRQDGSLATDSQGLIQEMNRGEAALLPLGGRGELMGGHKGYGLATMVEILSAAFQDGAFLSDLNDTRKNGKLHSSCIGHFFLAMNVGHFTPIERFRNKTGNILRELRASRKAPGEERIFTAGEKSNINKERVLEEGVEIPPGVQKALSELRELLDISENWMPD